MKVVFFFLAGLLLVPSAQATITLSSSLPSGASAYDTDTESKIPIIYGGLAGSCSGDTDSTCNSCTDTATDSTACNERQIYDTLKLIITLSSDSAGSGNVIITSSDGETALTMTNQQSVSGTNSFVTVTTFWSDICNALSTEVSNCSSLTAGATALSGNLRVGIDADSDSKLTSSADDFADLSFRVYNPESEAVTNTTTCNNIHGACSLVVFPGDEKVYLKSLTVPDSFSTISSDIVVAKLRLMYSEVNFNSISKVDKFKDFDVVDGGANISGFLDGLTNDTPYVFKFASIDSAGNIFNVLDVTKFEADCPIGAGDAPAISNNCDYIATPGAVLGLLSEDFSCFIATATLGSSWAPPLITLREFRNKVLLPQAWGKSFVLWYYKYGSWASHYVHKYPLIKALSLPLVWLAWGLASLSLGIGFAPSVILFLTLGLGVFIGFRRFRRRRLIP